MIIQELIESIARKHRDSGINLHPAATSLDIISFEKRMGFSLPNDFKIFYSICNGFECDEDLFNVNSFDDIMSHQNNYGANWFYFAEYMIYSDMWGLRLTSLGHYEIFNGSYPRVAMTSSLSEFLNKFLEGNVFDPGGLYNWQEELGIK
jgi:hypothetical protein